MNFKLLIFKFLINIHDLKTRHIKFLKLLITSSNLKRKTRFLIHILSTVVEFKQFPKLYRN